MVISHPVYTHGFGDSRHGLFGFGSPTEGERELMVKGLIGEVAACIIALFYSIFEINKKSDSTEINKIKSEIQAINNNIETLNSGDLNIEADNDNTSFDSSISKYEETINSYDIAPPLTWMFIR